MKKYLPLFLVFTVFNIFGYAQSLQLFTIENGTNVTNTTYTHQGTVAEDEIIVGLHVKNNSSSSMSVKVRRINQSIVPGTQNALCWGLCYSPLVNLSPTAITIDAGATNTVDFAGHYLPYALVGVSTVMYSFFDATNPNDSVWIIDQYDVTNTGVQNLSSNTNYISGAYPSPANNFVSFNFCTKGNLKGHIAIHNILGELIKKVDIFSSGSVKFNTSELKQGAYVVTFVVDDKIIKTSRFLVAH